MSLQAYIVTPQPSQREAERLALVSDFRSNESATASLTEGFAELAATIAQTPIAWISFVAAEHEFAISAFGARMQVVAADEGIGRSLVAGGMPVAYQHPSQSLPVDAGATIAYVAGFPLLTIDGSVVGGLCVADVTTRTLSLGQQAALTALSRKIVQALELNRQLAETRAKLHSTTEDLEAYAQKVGKLQDVTIAKEVQTAALVERNAELQSMADTDGLTGLHNYRSLSQHLQEAFNADEPVGIMLLDIDWFKNFNDAYGHVAGDETLRAVGNLIGSHATEGIMAARYGGEEFALVVPTSDTKYILQVGESLRQRIERHPWPSRPITVCVGAAVRTAGVDTIEDLIRRADEALYTAKRTGKNRVLAWSPR